MILIVDVCNRQRSRSRCPLRAHRLYLLEWLKYLKKKTCRQQKRSDMSIISTNTSLNCHSSSVWIWPIRSCLSPLQLRIKALMTGMAAMATEEVNIWTCLTWVLIRATFKNVGIILHRGSCVPVQWGKLLGYNPRRSSKLSQSMLKRWVQLYWNCSNWTLGYCTRVCDLSGRAISWGSTWEVRTCAATPASAGIA